jgi:hypothetical protein
MLSIEAKAWHGRALVFGAVATLALAAGTIWGTRDSRETDATEAPRSLAQLPQWENRCIARLDRARLELTDWSPEFGRARVRAMQIDGLSGGHEISVWLELPPQYTARIVWSAREGGPSVYDWEEAPTPVVGSFALHRRVENIDLTVVADDSDVRGQRFAQRMQPLLDDCLMDAR